MSQKRIVEEIPCAEHGEFAPHGVTLPNGEYRALGCRGSSRRVLAEGPDPSSGTAVTDSPTTT